MKRTVSALYIVKTFKTVLTLFERTEFDTMFEMVFILNVIKSTSEIKLIIIEPNELKFILILFYLFSST